VPIDSIIRTRTRHYLHKYPPARDNIHETFWQNFPPSVYRTVLASQDYVDTVKYPLRESDAAMQPVALPTELQHLLVYGSNVLLLVWIGTTQEQGDRSRRKRNVTSLTKACTFFDSEGKCSVISQY
jgi:hypothetical protein